MIRGYGTSEGKPTVLLGIDPENFDRLREGQPIRVNLRHLNPDGEPVEALPDLDVAIFFAGTDEVTMIERLFGNIIQRPL